MYIFGILTVIILVLMHDLFESNIRLNFRNGIFLIEIIMLYKTLRSIRFTSML